MVIMGSAEMLLEKSGGDERLRDEIDEIMNTAQRSAQLTQHLLAFSHRQAHQPVSLDPGLLIGTMERMLRRLIGEDIRLDLELAPDTGWIHADPGQIEQVIMNLVVNARDAMAHGGRLVIASANADYAHPTVIGQTEIPPGRFVALSVRDNGTGMADEAMEHLFEPFFTTKPAGVGTGLGLAIVYGIVRQSGGVITVDSTQGGGATFTLYLPRIEAPAAEPSQRRTTPAPRGAGEAILLVEDELPLNGMIRQSLEKNGYRVMTAATSDEAVAIAESRGGSLSLLLTDVVMPGTVTRRRMIEQILQLCPGIKVILMSGYADEVIAPHGVLEPGRAMLSKPFSMARLLAQVRTALDGP
jgi:CheY-like chemotaxis protein